MPKGVQRATRSTLVKQKFFTPVLALDLNSLTKSVSQQNILQKRCLFLSLALHFLFFHIVDSTCMVFYFVGQTGTT